MCLNLGQGRTCDRFLLIKRGHQHRSGLTACCVWGRVVRHHKAPLLDNLGSGGIHSFQPTNWRKVNSLGTFFGSRWIHKLIPAPTGFIFYSGFEKCVCRVCIWIQVVCVDNIQLTSSTQTERVLARGHKLHWYIYSFVVIQLDAQAFSTSTRIKMPK